MCLTTEGFITVVVYQIVREGGLAGLFVKLTIRGVSAR